jgi:protein-S-isoprenylcysteine O-methyltransferase Ste14
MRILPPRLFLLTLALMVLAQLLIPSPFQIPLPWLAFGIPLLVGGLGVTIVGARQFAVAQTNIRTFDEPTLMVTSGLFRVSRNPMYVGFTAALFGVATALGTLTPLLLALAFGIVADRWYIRFEERAMLAKFGSAYTAYAKDVRRWL